MTLIRSLKCDFCRAIGRGRIVKYTLFMTLFVLILFVTDDAFNADLPVLYYVTYDTSMHSFLLVYPIAFLIYGTSLIEDWQENYYRQNYLRTSIAEYALSKSFVNMLVSVITVCMSVSFAAILIGCVKSWSMNIGCVSFLGNTDVSNLYGSGNYLACVIYIGLQLGVLSGLLSSIAFFMSSIVKDKIFSAVMTFVGCMIVQYAWGIIDKHGLAFLGYFIINSNVVKGDNWMYKDLIMMCVTWTISTILTWLVLRRKVQIE